MSISVEEEEDGEESQRREEEEEPSAEENERRSSICYPSEFEKYVIQNNEIFSINI